MAGDQLSFGVSDGGPGGDAPLTVSALVGRIKEALLDALPSRLAVVGEISNFKRHGSGHLYFSLKDADAVIDAVMFRQWARGARFDIADGLEVVAEGRVDVYPKQGRLQLYVERLTPRGAGALELAFGQLKERLAGEGLFDPERKRPLAPFPRGVGVITSPTGAAVRDIARALSRRWPAARAYLVGVRVQGDSAAGEIAEAIRLLDASAQRLGIDTIIIARGGGSLEDLWAFNEEVVARAIFAAETPIISGVGHETDFTIADFVADVRAATPTAAAELAAPDSEELRRHCDGLASRLSRRLQERLSAGRNALAAVGRSAVFRDPDSPVRSARQQLDELTTCMRHALVESLRSGEQRLAAAERTLAERHPRRAAEAVGAALAARARDLAWALGRRAKLAADALVELSARIADVHPRHRARLARQRVDSLARQLDAMSYRAVLLRGYSVTRLAGGKILRSTADVGGGDALRTELADGEVRSHVVGLPGRKRKTTTDDEPTLFENTEE